MFEKFFRNTDIENAKMAVYKDPENILKLMILAKLYFNGHFYKEAIPILEKILFIDKNYFPALDFLGKSYIQTKQFLKAHKTLSYLYSLSPDDNIKLLLFSMQNMDCEKETMIEILEGLRKIENSCEVTEKLADLYLQTGQFSKSMLMYEELVTTEKTRKNFVTLSHIYIKLQKWQQASNTLEQLMLTDDFTVEDAKTLADTYIKGRHFNEAKGIYEWLVDACPEEAAVFKEKIAEVYLLKNKPDKTEAIVNNIIEENQYSVQAKFLNTEALISQKEYKKAIEFLREFYCDPVDKKTEKEIENKIVETCVLYSEYLREQKKFTEAIDTLTIALRYDENSAAVYTELANISEDIKDFSAASEYKKIAKSLSK